MTNKSTFSARPHISLKNASVSYGNFLALKNISGAFKPGSLTAVVGPNGSGKTTLIKAIQGLVPLKKGNIFYHNFKPIDIAYLPQKNNLDHTFPLEVQEVVAMGLWQETGFYDSINKNHKEAISHALNKVGLNGLAYQALETLSGGQFQRMLLARLILQNKPIIILDEPFTSVDQTTYHVLIKQIIEWHQEGRLVIVVLHELDIVQNYFPETLLLLNNIVGWGATKEILTPENIAHTFSFHEVIY